MFKFTMNAAPPEKEAAGVDNRLIDDISFKNYLFISIVNQTEFPIIFYAITPLENFVFNIDLH